MENFRPNPEQAESSQENAEQEQLMEDFYKKFFETQTENSRKISLDNLKELKEKGISTEQFLDHLCQNHNFLLHGSINQKESGNLRSRNNKIFATNRSAIAIMRSIYSNKDVNLNYPYSISEEDPLVLEIHTPPDGKFISADKGFIYIVDAADFKNDPEGSWQFINETENVEYHTAVETEKDDFKYPVKIYNDFKQK